MKVSPHDYNDLRQGCREVLKRLNWRPPHMSIGEVWDTFHLASDKGYIDLPAFYEVYNDAHIETALRRVFKKELKLRL